MEVIGAVDFSEDLLARLFKSVYHLEKDEKLWRVDIIEVQDMQDFGICSTLLSRRTYSVSIFSRIPTNDRKCLCWILVNQGRRIQWDLDRGCFLPDDAVLLQGQDETI